MQLQHLPLERFHPPRRASHEHTAAFGVFQCLPRIPQTRVLERQSGRGHRKMGKPIIALDILRIGEVVLRIKHRVRHLGPDLARIMGRIKAGDGAERGDTVPYRTAHYDTTVDCYVSYVQLIVMCCN